MKARKPQEQDLGKQKRESKQVVLWTGSAGSGRREFLAEVMSLCPESVKKEIVVHFLRDAMFEVAKKHSYRDISDERILDMDEDERVRIRSEAMSLIRRRINASDKRYHWVSTPTQFFWRGRDIRGLSEENVKRLRPTIFICITDDTVRIKERLAKDSQWRRMTLSFRDIARWQGIEMDNIRKLASTTPNYIIPFDNPPSVGYDLLFQPDKKRVYFSYSLTDIPQEVVKRGTELIQKLRKKYVVFDPRTIHDHEVAEMATVEKSTRVSVTIKYRNGPREYRDLLRQEILDSVETLDTNVVERDFYLIHQSDAVLVFYPSQRLSTGVICEMMYGHYQMKTVIAYHPHVASPFFRYICSGRRIFGNEDEWYDFVSDSRNWSVL